MSVNITAEQSSQEVEIIVSQVIGISEHSQLNLDDGTNPHGTTATDVGLGNVDNTSDADKPVSTDVQNALNLKANDADISLVGKSNDYEDLDNKPTLISNHSELNLDDGTNPHGTTATDVGLENVLNVEQYPATNPQGFETPAQLDARDTANRDRANHTGTQAIATIDNLQTELDSKANNTDILTDHSQLNLDDGTNPHGTTAIDVGVGWTSLSTQWSVEPSQIGTTVDGDVYEYTLLSTTRYRLVPSPYNPTLDAFYADWDGTNLSNLIISRG